MIYALLLLFFFLEYVRPTSYVPGLLALHLNSIVPLTAFAGTLLSAGSQTVQRLTDEPSTRIVVALLGLVALSVVTSDVQQNAWDAMMILLGFVFIYWVIAGTLTSVSRVKGVIKMLILVHLIVAALNPSLLTDPSTRHYITSGSFLGDGNDFALSLDIVVPLCLFLLLDSEKLIQRAFWGAALIVLVAAVVGTQSRGGTLGLAATALYYWFKSTRKFQTGVIAAGTVVLILALAPPSYFARISTIGDTEEGSAQGRITAWKAAVQMAVDNPLLGVGAAHFGIKIGNEYRPADFIGSGMTAHSVYFLALGELGLPGFMLVVALIWTNLSANRKVALEIRSRGGDTHSSELQLLAATSGALIGFATAGAFLSALYYPHLYVLAGLLTATRHVVRQRLVATAEAVPVGPVKPAMSLHWALEGRKPAWQQRQMGERR